MLHVGAKPIDYAGLRELETPAATPTHVPIPHFRVVDLVKASVGMLGHQIVSEAHGVSEDGMRYFGLLSLKSPYTDYEDTVGLRNSNDRAFPVGIGFGNRVFVCDNLAFIADHVIKRRHTVNLKRDLPGLVNELVEPLTEIREAQHKTIERYQNTPLTVEQADHVTMRAYRDGVVNLHRLGAVAERWSNHYDYENKGTAWDFFNIVTSALDGRVMENPQATPKLYKILDEVTVH